MIQEKKTSHFTARVSPSDKARWVKAANGEKLVRWVIRKLNKAAMEELKWKQ